MRLLAALDFSECSRLACAWALHFADRMGAEEIVFLHVLDAVAPSEAASASRLGELEHSVAQMRDVIDAETKHVLEHPLPESVVSYSTVRGEPAEAILHATQVNRIDVVVVGTHGKKGLQRLMLGSVAEKVVRGAECTVITVKHGPRR